MQILIVTVKFQPITPEVEDKLNIHEIEPLRRYLCFCQSQFCIKKATLGGYILKRTCPLFANLLRPPPYRVETTSLKNLV